MTYSVIVFSIIKEECGQRSQNENFQVVNVKGVVNILLSKSEDLIVEGERLVGLPSLQLLIHPDGRAVTKHQNEKNGLYTYPSLPIWK